MSRIESEISSESSNHSKLTDGIVVQGAAENTLQSISCEFPRHALSVVTGPSGSGKSSLVFDTIGREASFRFLSARDFAAGRLPRDLLSRPKVERISGLSFAVAIIPRRLRGFTPLVALSGIYDPLRLFFEAFAERHCGVCNSRVNIVSREEIVSAIREAANGKEVTLLAPIVTTDPQKLGAAIKAAEASGFSRLRSNEENGSELAVVIDQFVLEEKKLLRLREAVGHAVSLSRGAIWAEVSQQRHAFLEGSHCEVCGVEQRTLVPGDFVLPIRRDGSVVFPEEVLRLRIGGRSFGDLYGGSLSSAHEWIISLRATGTSPDSARLVEEIERRIEALCGLGLSYLELSRPVHSLSAGESQKAHLVRWLGGAMSGLTYLLDEPTLGLHPRDIDALVKLVQAIVTSGNTIIAVEHDESFIRNADHLVVLGPGAGLRGGKVVASGAPAKISPQRETVHEHPVTLTSKARRLEVRGVSTHNLKKIDVSIPLRALSAIVGVSGAGKSSLVTDSLVPALSAVVSRAQALGDEESKSVNLAEFGIEEIAGWEELNRVVDATTFVRMRPGRSTVATVAGILSPLRALYAMLPAARAHGYDARTFSYNDPRGWCPTCRGRGHVVDEKSTGTPVVFSRYSSPCPSCAGRRYRRELETIHYRGQSIADLFERSVEECRKIFEAVPELEHRLRLVEEFGLGYLMIGQDAYSLSLGEQQRLRLATSLFMEGSAERMVHGAKGTIFFFDELTRGLGDEEIFLLMKVLRRLVAEGGTVVMVDHNPQCIRHVDHVVELGPGAGPDGGEVIASGHPTALKSDLFSVIGPYL